MCGLERPRYTTDVSANTGRSPNVPNWSHEVIFWGTKQEC